MMINNVNAEAIIAESKKRVDELLLENKMTMLTCGGTEFMFNELKNDDISTYGKVTLVLKNNTSIQCDAKIKTEGMYNDYTAEIYVFADITGIDMHVDDIEYIKYKNYKLYVCDDITDGQIYESQSKLHKSAELPIAAIEVDTKHNNNRMASIIMAKMFLGVNQSIARDYMNNISKLEKGLNINSVDHFNSTCSYFRSKWSMTPDWFNHVDLVKHNFSNKFMTMRNDKYRINAFIASINDVDITIETDTETNENHLVYKIKFNKLLNESYGIGLCNMYKTDTLWLRDDGKIKLYDNSNFEERCHVVTSGHRIFNITIYGRRYSISYEKLVAVALDVYNNDMLDSYVDIQCNVKSCTGSINKIEQLIDSGCIIHGNIYVPHNLEYCDRTSNVAHASLYWSLYNFIGSYDYMISAYNYELHDKIRSYITAGRAFGGINYKQCRNELLAYLDRNVLRLSELYDDINMI